MQAFEKLPQISGLCSLVKFCSDSRKTDPQMVAGPLFGILLSISHRKYDYYEVVAIRFTSISIKYTRGRDDCF